MLHIKVEDNLVACTHTQTESGYTTNGTRTVYTCYSTVTVESTSNYKLVND